MAHQGLTGSHGPRPITKSLRGDLLPPAVVFPSVYGTKRMAAVINLMVSGKVRIDEDISVALSSSKAEPNKMGANYCVTLIYGHHETSLCERAAHGMGSAKYLFDAVA